MDLSGAISIIMRKAATEAGERLMEFFGSPISSTDKTSHQDIVTEADKQSQLIIQSTIRRRIVELGYDETQIGFIGEEELNVKGKYTFIIDPLDGTTNFAAGMSYFTISIACAREGEIFSGLIYDPVRKIFYSADLGKGAFRSSGLDKNPLKMRPQDLKKSVAAVHFSSSEMSKETFKAYEELFPKMRALRVTGSQALDMGMLADNIYGSVITATSCLWDVAAAYLIVKESGGVVTDWDGKDLALDLEDKDKKYKIVACDGSHLKEIVECLNKN